MDDLMRQLQEMQRKADELQQGLASMEVEGEAGAGLVHATVNGLGKLIAVKIDPSLMKPGESGIVEDLVVAAAADAKEKLETQRIQDTAFLQDLLKSFTGPGSQ
jgi:nucleoid-associated protein EbfC